MLDGKRMGYLGLKGLTGVSLAGCGGRVHSYDAWDFERCDVECQDQWRTGLKLGVKFEPMTE